jgi:hypothetical protein
MGSVTAARVASPTLLDVILSFERHLRAENKAARTIQSYTEAVRRLHDFCSSNVDRIAAARQAKRRECVERLSKILAKEFDLDELRFIATFDYDAIRIEAYEIARTKARR